MVAGEIHMNQEVKMQAAASKDKRPGVSENKDVADDPTYENITLTFRKQDKSKGSHMLPENQARSRSPPDGAQVPPWLYRAILSLYALLALTLTFCIILSAVVLVKSNELSGQLWNLERELQNASNSTQSYQASQKQTWNKVEKWLSETKKNISTVVSNVKDGNTKLHSVSTAINTIKEEVNKLSKSQQKSDRKPRVVA